MALPRRPRGTPLLGSELAKVLWIMCNPRTGGDLAPARTAGRSRRPLRVNYACTQGDAPHRDLGIRAVYRDAGNDLTSVAALQDRGVTLEVRERQGPDGSGY